MAGGIEKVGATGLQMTLGFPDVKARDDFELAFRAWLQQRKREIVTEAIVGSAVQRAAEDSGEDVGGHLFGPRVYTKTAPDGTKVSVVDYWDFLPLI
ncbi:MAG: hypothetical protein IT201_02235 [Thermoleophilia bacterium]|nr:hypothetical protein [Thermoleophilia bacterium]